MAHYLDNAATTAPSDAALDGIREALQYPGNPSSVHSPGLEAHRFLVACREKIAASLGIRHLGSDKLVLTASGTEANNLSLLGMAGAKNRKPIGGFLGTILLSDGEHPSMEEPAQQLEKSGYRLVRIPTRGGVLDLGALQEELRTAPSPVIYAGFMLVNNETGALYDVKNAFRLVKLAFPQAICHCDAVQGYMKTRFTPQLLGVDTLSVSAHKIHSTRGAGALYINQDLIKRKAIVPILPGGGQEGGLRSGTENLVAIGAFARAAQAEYAAFEENRRREQALRDLLDTRMAPLYQKGVTPHIPAAYLPGVLTISLPRIRSEIMLNYLSGKGIYVSAGSACSAHAKKESRALRAFGLSSEEMDGAIRISLSHTNTEEDILALTEALDNGISSLQRK